MQEKAKQTLLFILNDAPYGSERSFNALRLAINLNEQDCAETSIKIFLMSDAVSCALPRQIPGEGYNVQQMLEILLSQGAEIKLCKTCCNARGLVDMPLIDGAKIGTLDDLSMWTLEADKVVSF
ncbi:DsrE family protein [Photobacterium sp. SDRW27]|uniref:DsrE/DsrF/TusD sulfur relay family protein n=1 Tax=Photobacterium obscurum TaxID=2829490 RepID=UPI0022441A16|nr:DsrE family protein [Photobacterium obscurum]MCW8328665.1 DsrE family protein [Photobacterium obscurum]